MNQIRKAWVKVPHWSAAVSSVPFWCMTSAKMLRQSECLDSLLLLYETGGFIMQQKVIKRDGQVVDFDSSKITSAICKASSVTKEFDSFTARRLTKNVIKIVNDFVKEKQSNLEAPTIEEIQDIVEKVLLSSEYKQTAKSYILYREQHKNIRDYVNHKTDFIAQYKESANTANAFLYVI